MEIKNSGKRKRRLSRGQEHCSEDVTLSRDPGRAKGLPIEGARLNRVTAKAEVGRQAMEDMIEGKGEGIPRRA